MVEIPDWAMVRACDLARAAGMEDDGLAIPNGPYTGPLVSAFAAYIAAHEEAPVDPLLIEAREMWAKNCENVTTAVNARPPSELYRDGSMDGTPNIRITVAALKRGIELASDV